MDNPDNKDHQHNIEIVYRKIFGRLNTRKKFTIQSIEGTTVTVEQDEEICGKKNRDCLCLTAKKSWKHSSRRKISLNGISIHSCPATVCLTASSCPEGELADR